MKHGKDAFDSELNQCFVLIEFPLKKNKTKQNNHRKKNQQKNPVQQNFLLSDEKVTMVTREKDQTLPFCSRAAHTSSRPVCSGGEGCQETFHSKCRPSVPEAAAPGEPWGSARGLAAPGRHHLRSPTHPLIWHPLAYCSSDAGFGAIYGFCVCLCLLKGEARSLSLPRVNTLSGSSNTYFMTWLLCFNRLSSSSSTWAGGLVALQIQLWWLKATLHLAPFFRFSPEVWDWLALAVEPTFAISLSTFQVWQPEYPSPLCLSGIPVGGKTDGRFCIKLRKIYTNHAQGVFQLGLTRTSHLECRCELGEDWKLSSLWIILC